MSESLDTLLHFVRERESIRLKKLAGEPPPWTNDPILQTYRFTNIRRRDDRVSQWLIKNVLKQEYTEANLRNFLLFSAWCRYINWPPTIDAVLQRGFYPAQQIDWVEIGRFVDSLRGKKWTAAYMVLAPKQRNLGKGVFISQQVIGTSMALVVDVIVAWLRASEAPRQLIWLILRDCRYFGDFMAGQCVDDWTWTPLLAKAPDLYTWAPMGPGSIRGYNRMLGLPLRKRPKPDAWNSQLQSWRRSIITTLGPEYEDLTAADAQNCWCEGDKYLRVKNGEGRPRTKYRPETAF
jgi:hypothetical protein